jgi:hypothetical protein
MCTLVYYKSLLSVFHAFGEISPRVTLSVLLFFLRASIASPSALITFKFDNIIVRVHSKKCRDDDDGEACGANK